MKEYTFEILGEPIALQRAKVTTINGFARAYTPKKSRDYETSIAWTLIDKFGHENPSTGPIRVEAKFYFPLTKADYKANGELTKKGMMKVNGEIKNTNKKDIDNCVKSLFDGITKAGNIWVDDKQVVELHCTKEYSQRARTEVTIEIIE